VRPAAQPKPVTTQPRPPTAQPKPVEVDPEVAARRTARLARQDALWLRLRAISPALFATAPPPPMMIGVYNILVERLGLDAEGTRALGHILNIHVNRVGYQKALAALGHPIANPYPRRADLDGNPAGKVTEDEGALAGIKGERLKARLKAKKKAAPDGGKR
jgi:sRNA-binding protein